MERNKMFKILGIGILSLVGLGILLFITFLPLQSSRVVNSGIDYLGQRNTLGGDYLLTETGKIAQDSYSPTSLEQAPTPIQERASGTDEKNVIRIGQIGFSADDIDETKKDIETIITKYGGEISNSMDSGSGKTRSVSIVIKIEEESFEEIFNELEEVDAEKIYSSSSADDVTEQVMDLTARLNTYKNTEEQLLEIQKQSTNVTDTMAVYRELNEIRYKIEATESQLKYYANQTDYSTISVSITQSSVGTFEPEEKWRPLGVFKDAIRALGIFAMGLVNVTIWFVVFGVPIVMVIVLIVYLVKRNKK